MINYKQHCDVLGEKEPNKMETFCFCSTPYVYIGLLSSEIDILIKKEHLHNIKRNDRRLVNQVYIKDTL